MLDWNLLDAIGRIKSPFLDFWMPKITLLGNGGILWILLSVILLCHPKSRRCGQTLAIAMILIFLFGNCLLKPLVARPRPFTLNPELILLIPPPTDFSFPSGHTYAGIAATVVIWHYNQRWGLTTLILALLIAFTRLYLMVHFPTDILGGILLGCFCGFFALWITKRKR